MRRFVIVTSKPRPFFLRQSSVHLTLLLPAIIGVLAMLVLTQVPTSFAQEEKRAEREAAQRAKAEAAAKQQASPEASPEASPGAAGATKDEKKPGEEDDNKPKDPMA